MSTVKRFLKAVFWRGNSDVGVLFTFALVATLRAVLLTGLFALLLLTLAGVSVFGAISVSNIATYSRVFTFATTLMSLYSVVLTLLFLMDLYIKAFQCQKRIAVVLSLLLPVAGMPACSWKLRNGKAFIVSVTASVCWVAGIACRFIPVCQGITREVCVLGSMVMLAVAIYFLSPRRSLLWLGTLYMTLTLLYFITPRVIYPRLNAIVETRKAQMPERCAVTFTWEAWQAEMNAADAELPEPFKTLHDERQASASTNQWKLRIGRRLNAKDIESLTNAIPAAERVKTVPILNPFLPPTQEEIEAFQQYETAYASRIAVMDEVTDPRAPHTDQGYPVAFSIPPRATQGLGISEWGRYYANKAIMEAHHGNTNAVRDLLQRTDGIRAYYETSLMLINKMLGMPTEMQRLTALQAAIHLLSDDDLAQMQKGLSVPAEKCLRQIASVYYGESTVLEDLIVKGCPENQKVLCSTIGTFVSIWLCFERLSQFKRTEAVCKVLNDASLSEAERYSKAGQAYNAQASMPLMQVAQYNPGLLIKSLATKTDYARAAETGIAVERYRRKYNLLPETLAALVPEFIERLPISARTGEPLRYTTGAIDISTKDVPDTFVNGYRIDNGCDDDDFRGFTVALEGQRLITHKGETKDE